MNTPEQAEAFIASIQKLTRDSLLRLSERAENPELREAARQAAIGEIEIQDLLGRKDMNALVEDGFSRIQSSFRQLTPEQRAEFSEQARKEAESLGLVNPGEQLKSW